MTLKKKDRKTTVAEEKTSEQSKSGWGGPTHFEKSDNFEKSQRKPTWGLYHVEQKQTKGMRLIQEAMGLFNESNDMLQQIRERDQPNGITWDDVCEYVGSRNTSSAKLLKLLNRNEKAVLDPLSIRVGHKITFKEARKWLIKHDREFGR